MTLLEELKNAIIDVQPKKAEEITQRLLDQAVGAAEILNQALIPGMDEVGRLFKEGEYYVPEVLVAAKAMNAILRLIEPLLIQDNVPRRGKIVVGTVEGDLHDIGKNLVSMMLKGAGYTIIDLGVDVKAEQFIEAVQKEKPDYVAISALLTSTMLNIPAVIQSLNTAGLRNRVKVLVGGAPLTRAYAEEICADGYAVDAADAVRLVRQMDNTELGA
jgi:corrinoid protein of di/trimethylamine methyltransferase